MAGKIVDPFDSEPKFEKKRTEYEMRDGIVDPFDSMAEEQKEAAFQTGLKAMQPGGVLNPYSEKVPKTTAEMMGVNGSKKEFDIPEFDLPFEVSGRQIKTAAGLLTTFDPERELSVLKSNYPNLQFAQDKYGNLMADGREYGGDIGYVNLPGISVRDLTRAGFQMAAFTPAAKTAGLAKTFTGKMASVGAASGATEIGQDIANQALGGEENVSVGNIDLKNAGIAAAGGGVFEGLGTIFRSFGPRLKTMSMAEFKEAFRKEAVKHGYKPEQITDDLIARFMQDSQDATSAAAQRGEFGIRQTKGQASGSQKQLDLEDSLRGGAFGPAARDKMLEYQRLQSDDITQAASREQAGFGGAGLDRPGQAGEIAGEAIRSKASALAQQIDDAYGSIPRATLKPEGVKGLNNRLRRVAKVEQFERGEGFEQTTKTLKELDNFDQFVKEGNTVKATTLKQLEGFRKRIGTRIGAAANQSDKRQLTVIKKELDNYLDRAIDRHLFTGDEQALSVLKEARQLRTEWANKFQRMDVSGKFTGRKFKDEGGEIMERIVNADPTGEEVINYMFGVSKFASKQSGGKVASRIKDVLGENSKEWNSIREAAFMRLAKPGKDGVISGRQFANRLDDALENPKLMRELFSSEEIARMRFFASAIKRVQPEIGNPSKTSYKLAQLANQAWEKIATMIGFSTGGVAGAVIAKEGSKAVGGFRAVSKAKNAITHPLRSVEAIPAMGAPASVGAAYSLGDRDNPPAQSQQ